MVDLSRTSIEQQLYEARIAEVRRVSCEEASRSVDTLDDLLCEAKLKHLRTECDWARLGSTLCEWADALVASRPNFLRSLKDCGVQLLTDRQSLSNALARARREGRINSTASPSNVTAYPESPISDPSHAVGQGCQVLLRLDVTRLHTGYLRTGCILLTVRDSLARVMRLMVKSGSIAALQLELDGLPARVGFEQELSSEAMRILELGSRFGSAAAVDCVLRWLHEGWESVDPAAAQLNATALVPMKASGDGQRADCLQRWAEKKQRPLDLQAVFTVLLMAQGNRKIFSGRADDVQNEQVMDKRRTLITYYQLHSGPTGLLVYWNIDPLAYWLSGLLFAHCPTINPLTAGDGDGRLKLDPGVHH